MIAKTVASSVLIIGILVIRALFQKRVNPVFIYALWLLAALRLLMPGMLFFSPVSIMNTNLWRTASAWLSEEENRQDREYKQQMYRAYYEQKILEEQGMAEQESNKAEMEKLSESPVESGQAESSQTENRYVQDSQIMSEQMQGSQSIDQEDGFHVKTDSIELKWQWSGTLFGRLKQLAGMIWMAGMVITALIFFWQNLSFYYYLRAVRKEFTKIDTGRRKLSVYLAGDKLSSPCLFGVVPAVYIPEGSMRPEDEEQLAFVLEHELTHYRHGDPVWAFVRILCLVINWYHPLAWIGAKLSMQDGELACDAGCISRLGESKRCAYGEALLAMVRATGEKEKPLKAATMMTSEKKFMKKRIERIAEKKKSSLLALTIIVSSALFMVGCTYTGTSRLEEAKPNQEVESAQTNPVRADEEGAEAEQKDDKAEKKEESSQILYNGKAVMIKGEGEEINGTLQSMLFLVLPGPDKNQTKEKYAVMISGDLYMPGPDGNGSVLADICKEYTPHEILEVLNKNLELQLEEIEVWGYETLIRKVDEAGGIPINVKEEEIEHLNNYQLMMTGEGKLSEGVNESGMQILDGMQTAAYLQINWPGSWQEKMDRWEQVVPVLLENENLKIIDCMENYFAGYGQTIYVESWPKNYFLCLNWEEEVCGFHEDFYPEQNYQASAYVKETDRMMEKQAKEIVIEGRKEAYQASILFTQYMGRNPFMISLITGSLPDPETEDVWGAVTVWISQTGLVVDEESGKAVMAVNLVFDDAGTLHLPEYTRENPVTVQRFLYLTKKEDGWYVDGFLHNNLPSEEWWEGMPQEWEICEYGFSDEDTEGILTKSQKEYDAFVEQALKAAKNRGKLEIQTII